MQTLREINQKLSSRITKTVDPDHYSPDERAGFNYGKAICAMIERLRIDEIDFLNGVLKPLNVRLKYLQSQKRKSENDLSGD